MNRKYLFLFVFFSLMFFSFNVKATLNMPSNPLPADNENLSTGGYLRWSVVEGASYYQYTIDYIFKSSDEKSSNCDSLVGQKVVPETTISSNSVSPKLNCLGIYNWAVRACSDQSCANSSEWSLWKFNLVQGVISAGGLVPCGRSYDDPATDYNEREQCGIKHIFFLLKNILDFILWRLGLIILVILVLINGVTIYFSLGGAEAMIKVKALLRSAITGYALILLGWCIINIILAIVGYQGDLFGPWFKISF